MLDFGFDKMALIGAVALIVIGPEKLPKVARTVGTLLGKAQRYVADVKAEVNRSMELEELQKMRTQFQDAAQEVHDTVHRTMRDPGSFGEPGVAEVSDAAAMRALQPPPAYKLPRKNWRLKRAAVPAWYKQRNGVRMHAQSGAARVSRFRPRQGGGSAI